MVKTYSNCTVVLENLEVTYMEDHRDLSFLRVNTALHPGLNMYITAARRILFFTYLFGGPKNLCPGSLQAALLLSQISADNENQ